MPFSDEELSTDTLPNKLILKQPISGFRSGSDALLLAESISYKDHSNVLDIGCGSGAVALSILKNNPSLYATGLEIQEPYFLLSQDNAIINQSQDRFNPMLGDIDVIQTLFKPDSFDYIVSNPPFYDTSQCRPTYDTGKNIAHAYQGGLVAWLRACLYPLKNYGFIAIIIRTDRLGDVYKAFENRCGNFVITPIVSGKSGIAKRILIVAQKARKNTTKILYSQKLKDF